MSTSPDALLTGGAALALGAAVPPAARATPFMNRQRGTLLRWARDTWRCLAAMTDAHTGLIADNVDGAG